MPVLAALSLLDCTDCADMVQLRQVHSSAATARDPRHYTYVVCSTCAGCGSVALTGSPTPYVRRTAESSDWPTVQSPNAENRCEELFVGKNTSRCDGWGAYS